MCVVLCGLPAGSGIKLKITNSKSRRGKQFEQKAVGLG